MIIMTFIGVVVGQRFAGQRIKSKFRPSGDWFANMQGSADSPSIDTISSDLMQNDQPFDDSSLAFQDFFVDDYEPFEMEEKEGKLPRAAGKKVEIFQNICPYINTTVFPGLDDPEFEYIPSHYQKITCAYPYQQHSRLTNDQKKNHVCHSDRGFNCVQLTSSIFLLKRRRVIIDRLEKGKECWHASCSFLLETFNSKIMIVT